MKNLTKNADFMRPARIFLLFNCQTPETICNQPQANEILRRGFRILKIQILKGMDGRTIHAFVVYSRLFSLLCYKHCVIIILEYYVERLTIKSQDLK